MSEIKDENFNAIIEEMENDEKANDKSNEPEQKSVSEEIVKENQEESENQDKTELGYYPHIEIMNEEGISQSELPQEIQSMIVVFKRKKTLAEKRNATDEEFLQVRNLSVIIADKIMDWLERDIPKEEKNTEVDQEEIDEKTSDESKESTEKQSNSIFGGILGGILDW